VEDIMAQNAAEKLEQEPVEVVRRLEELQAQFSDLKTDFEAMKDIAPENKLSMIVFSGELDKVLAAFVIATGAVAMGMDVVMFFTF